MEVLPKLRESLGDILKIEKALNIFNEIKHKITEDNTDIVKILFILGQQK